MFLPLALASGLALAQTSVSLVDLQTYGTFHAGGVEVTIAGDSDEDATVALEVRSPGGAWQPAHPLSRVAADRFLGSLFWLAPGTHYEVRVTLADPDGVAGGATQSAPLVTRPDTLTEPSVRTLYVAIGGDDNGPGTTPGAPLGSIQEAADRAQPGDLISIAPGTYHESVTVTASGTEDQPIVFRGSAPGVVLDGADETIAGGVNWTPEGDGVFSVVPGFTTGHIVTEAGRLFRYDNLADLQALPTGPPGGFWSGSGGRVYVKLAGGDSPELHSIFMARYENGLYLDGVQHVRIEEVELRHYGAGDFGKGVYLRFAAHCAVRRTNIHEVGSAGIWIKGGGPHLIEENTLWDSSIVDWPWDWTKGSSSENNAITLTDDVQRGNVIRRNRIWGTFNGIGACGSDPPATGLAVETDLYDNDLSAHTDDAFEPEGHCANVRLWSNRVQDVHMAFAVAPAAPGPTYLLRNIAYNFGNTRSSQIDGYSASALKINSGFPVPVGPLYLYHNTWLTEAPDTDALILLNPGNNTYIVARNNVFAGTRHALDKVNPVTLDWNYDNLYTSHPSRFVRWQGTQLPDLASLVAATGQEAAGLEGPPDLVDPATGVFEPRANSPLVDAGLWVAGINDHYSGAAPEIGAIEVGPIFADGFESGNTLGWSGGG